MTGEWNRILFYASIMFWVLFWVPETVGLEKNMASLISGILLMASIIFYLFALITTVMREEGETRGFYFVLFFFLILVTWAVFIFIISKESNPDASGMPTPLPD